MIYANTSVYLSYVGENTPNWGAVLIFIVAMVGVIRCLIIPEYRNYCNRHRKIHKEGDDGRAE